MGKTVKSVRFQSYKSQIHTSEENDQRKGKVKIVYSDGSKATIRQVLRSAYYSGQFQANLR